MTIPRTRARARFGRLTSRGRREALQRAQDAADLAECEAIVAAQSGPGISHDEFMAMLDAEDAARA